MILKSGYARLKISVPLSLTSKILHPLGQTDAKKKRKENTPEFWKEQRDFSVNPHYYEQTAKA